LQIDEARVGRLVGVFGCTLPVVLIAGFLVDEVGKQIVLSAGFLLVIASLLIFAALRSYRVALGAVLLLGTGWSALVNVVNVISPPAFLPKDEIPTRMAYAMNMGDFIFGMGAFVMPLFAAYLIRKAGLERMFLALAALAVVPLLLAFGVDWEALEHPAATGSILSLLADPIVQLCCIAFVCHVPIETSIAAWATTLMTDKGVGEVRASAFLSAFWLTFMASRLATALALQVGADAAFLTALSGATIVLTLCIALSRAAWFTCAMVVAAGLILGPIFPTLIAILMTHVEPSMRGRAVGVFFCIGGIGWTVIPI
jgi:fucose permease